MPVGFSLGTTLGQSDGARLGSTEGISECFAVGAMLGSKLGPMECAPLGSIDGSLERALIGILLGNALEIGNGLGSNEGSSEYCIAGA